MKYNPQRTIQLTVPRTINEVREAISKVTAEKKDKKDADAAKFKFLGKLSEAGFKLTPFPRRGCYDPVVSGELTEVRESRPETEEAEASSTVSSRADITLNMRPLPKLFSWLWLALCAVLLGLALWLCFKKGFDRWYWTLFIGPAFFIIERLVCNIGFGVSARKTARAIKDLLK